MVGVHPSGSGVRKRSRAGRPPAKPRRHAQKWAKLSPRRAIAFGAIEEPRSSRYPLFGHLEVALDGDRDLRWRHRGNRCRCLRTSYCIARHRYRASISPFCCIPDDEESAARAKLRATLSELPKILPSRGPVRHGRAPRRSPGIPMPTVARHRCFRGGVERPEPPRPKRSTSIAATCCPRSTTNGSTPFASVTATPICVVSPSASSEARRNANLALAIETARRVLAVDPWREDIVRRIIAMRYESGDGAGALSEYAAFAKRLRAEMDAEPMAETAAVAERVARGQAPPTKTAGRGTVGTAGESAVCRSSAAATRWSVCWRLGVGRLAVAARVRSSAATGHRKVANGLEFAHAVEDRGGRVFIGTTSSPEAVPYESIVDALRSALPLVASLEPSMALASVAALLPELPRGSAFPRSRAWTARANESDSSNHCFAA